MKSPHLLQLTTVALLLSSHSFGQTFDLPLPPPSDTERAFALEALPATRAAAPRELKELSFLRSLETICGVDDMIDVELYSGTLGPTVRFVTDNQPSTGQIQWNNDLQGIFGAGAGNVNGERWCTGTLISDDLFLTAGHCFDKQNNPFGWRTPLRGHQQIEPNELALNMHINFNYQVNGQTHSLRQQDEFPIHDLIEHRNGGLDYAIVRVGRSHNGDVAGLKYGYRLIATDMPQNGQRVTIMQHPAGQPKKVEAGVSTFFGDTDVTCGDLDTLGGSSGSAVLNTQGLIIAVHTNGGCGPTSGRNRGLSTRKIAEFSRTIR